MAKAMKTVPPSKSASSKDAPMKAVKKTAMKKAMKSGSKSDKADDEQSSSSSHKGKEKAHEVKKRPSTQYAESSMSLKEKLEMWKSKNNVDEPLELNHVEQKQLSSKFKHALKTAPEDAQSAYSEACSKSSGKNSAKQAIVKAWLLDNKWGESFLGYQKSLTLNQGVKRMQKPQTLKELEQKYTEEEINELLQSGGLQQICHDGSTRVKMYIDNGNWEKSRTFDKTRTISKTSNKHDADEDELDQWDTGFDKCIVDFDKAESLFLKDCKAFKEDEEEDDGNPKTTKNKASMKNLENISFEDANKLNVSASSILNNRVFSYESLLTSLKKNQHFTGSLRKTSGKWLEKMQELQETSRTLNKQGGPMATFKSHLTEVSEVVKDVAKHVVLLRKL